MPLPNILEFIGTNVTQAGFKAAQEKLLNFLSGEAATKVELSAAVTPKADKTYVDSALTSFQNGAIKTYPTLAAANADIANIALNTKVSVLSETDGGDYYKASASATSLTKSAYDPLTQAKIDATTKADNAEANAKSYTNDISTDTVQFSAEKIKIFTGSYNLTTNTIETYPSWKSFKYKLSGKEIRISGKFAAHYNGLNGTANNIKLPAISFFDKDAKLISYLMPTDSANGKAYDLAVDVPKNADYVLLNYCTASVNNLPANMSGYGIVTVLTEKTLSNSTDVNALNLVQQNGLGETNEKTILLNMVVKNPMLLMGKEGIYSFDSVYQNWFSHRIDLTGYSKITGAVSAHRRGGTSTYVPALVLYDANDNVVGYVEHSNDSSLLIDINIKVTSNMVYAIANVDISKTNNNLVLTKSTGSIPLSKSIANLKTIVEDNGLGDLNTLNEELTGKVNDGVVYTGDSGNYVKTNTYTAWYALRIDLTNALKVTGAGSSYYNGGIRIPAVVVFNSSGQVVKFFEFATQQPGSVDRIDFNFDVTPEMAYMYIQYQNLRQYPYIQVKYATKVSLGISERIDLIESELNKPFPKLSLLKPNSIYNVANDIDYKLAGQTYTGARSELKRNFSTVLHLDNYIPFIDHEVSITFEDGNIKKIIPAYSPVITAGAIENPNLNNGSNVYTETVTYKVKGNQSEDQTFTLENRSVLNSASKDKVPTILIIGDSVSFGQDAYFAGSKNKWNYTMILNKMFMNDRAQNGGTGYGFRTVGTIAYTDKDGNKSFNEAYSGQTLQGNGLFTNSKFLDSNNAFSFQNWLDKYRTCDDSGNRLYFNTSGATTGTAGTNNIGYLADGSVTSLKIGSLVSNTLSHDVYAPTHVFCFHASNATIGVSDYNLFISRVRAVFPNAVIGLGVPHVAGTYFPSKYPNVYRPAIWQYDQTYNNRHVTTMQTLINNFWNSTQEANKVFVLPTFWVNPSVDAFSSITINNPYSDIVGAEETLTMAVGQRVDVHVGSKAQAAYAYQLYAWLKWTAANALF
ncbi:hypothetical protein [Acinetobacter pittii]|uniref:hypothetical protein n=1 Tax=Acinetobacter pittii TaxID=48296 RepID=UPI0003189238|nr:hypothetical protein [Acinetobacter pittii]